MANNQNHSVGQTIANLRKKKGLTQIQLAEELYVSDKAVSKWEQDDSCPSIDTLIMLSEYFNVSIDYILKGKTPEKEIVTISKLELCAKNDDLDMLKQLSFKTGYFDTKDENGHSIAYYIVKHNSHKLLKEIIDDIPSLHKHLMETVDDTDICDLASRFALENGYSLIGCLSKCIGKETYAYMLKQIEKTEKCFDVLSHEKFDAEATSIFNEVINYACTIKCYKAFEYLLDEQIKRNEKNPEGNYRRFISRYATTRATKRQYVTVRDETIQFFFENGNFDMVRKINKLNEYGNGTVISEHDIEIKRQRLEKVLSKAEIDENEVLYDGILNLEQLYKTNDLPFIVKMLEKHPVHVLQFYEMCLKEGNYRKAYKFAVDSGDRNLSKLIKERKTDAIEEYILRAYCFYLIPWRINKYNFNNINILRKYAPRNEDGDTIFDLPQTLSHWPVCFKHCTNRMIEEAKAKMAETKKSKD